MAEVGSTYGDKAGTGMSGFHTLTPSRIHPTFPWPLPAKWNRTGTFLPSSKLSFLLFVLWPFVLASNFHLRFFPLYSFLLKYVYSRKYVLRCVQLFATPWTLAHQAPLSMGFSQEEFWSELPFPPPGDLSDPGIRLQSLASPVLAGWFFTTSTTWEAQKL